MATQAERRAAGRERLIEAAATLLAKGGFTGSSCAEIGQRAEMSRGAVNFYFGSKAALLEVLITEKADEWSSLIRRVNRELPEDASAADVLDAHWRAWRAVPGASQLLAMIHYEASGPSPHAQPLVAGLSAAATAYVRARLLALQLHGRIADDVDLERATQALRAGVLGLNSHAALSDSDVEDAYVGLRDAFVAQWAPTR